MAELNKTDFFILDLLCECSDLFKDDIALKTKLEGIFSNKTHKINIDDMHRLWKFSIPQIKKQAINSPSEHIDHIKNEIEKIRRGHNNIIKKNRGYLFEA